MSDQTPSDRRAAAAPLRFATSCTAAASVVVFVALWAVFIRTETGRQLGDEIWRGSQSLPGTARELSDSSLRNITTATLCAGCVLRAAGRDGRAS